jgi:hypothetical protein
MVIAGFVWIAVIGTIVSAVIVWRNAQRRDLRTA